MCPHPDQKMDVREGKSDLPQQPWDARRGNKQRILARQRSQGRVRGEMERLVKSEGVRSVGSKRVWESVSPVRTQKPQMGVNCYFLLAGPFGKFL